MPVWFFFLFGLVGAIYKWFVQEEYSEAAIVFSIVAVVSIIFSGWNLFRNVFNKGGFQVEMDPDAKNFLARIEGSDPVPGSPLESVVRDCEVDSWIREQPKIILEKNCAAHGAVRSSIRAKSLSLEKYLRTSFYFSIKNGQQFSDDPKICLAEDVVKGMSVSCFYIGTYFDSFCTNEFCTKILSTRSAMPEKAAAGITMFPSLEGRLKPISTSLMNNHVGVSTLAITSDGFIRLWRQSNRNQVSQGKVVATGSGSLDEDDVSIDRELLKTVCIGMEREFREESSKMGFEFVNDPVMSSRVIGYFRWVKRGGKPEFVGVTRLCVPLAELEPNLAEVDAPTYADLTFPARTWGEIYYYVNQLLEKYDHFSPSCWVALKCLSELAELKPVEWEDFLFGSS